MTSRIIILLTTLFCSLAFSQTKQEKIDDLLSKFNEYEMLNGSVLIADKGEIIFKKGYGFANLDYEIPNSENTVHRLGSITKQFTSAVIMQLVEEGKIKLEEKMTAYLKNYRKDTGDKVTIHHLLTHTSGIPSYTGYPGFWSDSSRNPYTIDQLVEKFCMGDLEFGPGFKYSYNNSGYLLLAKIIEEVTAKSFEQNIKERIFIPLEMKNSYLERPEKIIKNKASGYNVFGSNFTNTQYFNVGNAIGAGDIASTVEDLYLWDQALYTDKILSEESKNKTFTPFLNNYGYGWGIRKYGIPGQQDSLTYISHSGGINGFSTIISRFIENKQLIVILNNTGSAPLNEMVNGIMKILYDQEFTYPKKPIGKHLYQLVDSDGIDNAIAEYERLKENESDKYSFSENEINTLGYLYLRENKIDNAIKIFQLNIDEYPKSYNTYDSMGEAYMISGNKEKAIEFYRKSVELNSQNKNGYNMLNKLGYKIEPPADFNVTGETLQKFIGEYELFPNFKITISSEGNNLFAQATGQGKFQVYPEAENIFYYKVVQAKIEFINNENNEVNKLILYQNNQEVPGKKIQ
ncbi:MAG: serine hydrolase [Ignavibacteriales bacterium]|nr:serine hydrolase [Ignavibacteriales bacterium]